MNSVLLWLIGLVKEGYILIKLEHTKPSLPEGFLNHISLTLPSYLLCLQRSVFIQVCAYRVITSFKGKVMISSFYILFPTAIASKSNYSTS